MCACVIPAGDYQTGAWDTDAAENVAYDIPSKRAFLASAETGAVQVIDVADPTSMLHVSTLDVGATLRSQCTMPSCIYDGMDFGGADNPCGYAPTINIIVSEDNGGFTFPGWYTGPTYNQTTHPAAGVINNVLDSPAKCQILCQNTANCAFFSYELEHHSGHGGQLHECFLKGCARLLRFFYATRLPILSRVLVERSCTWYVSACAVTTPWPRPTLPA